MLNSLLSGLRSKTSNDKTETRRRHPRRESDRCVIVIHGRTFPVANWSMGGVLSVGDERLFGNGQEVEFTLRFKLRNTVMDVQHRGHVLRKSPQKVAVVFEPVTKTVNRYFQQVIDDAAAREFANSQAAG